MQARLASLYNLALSMGGADEEKVRKYMRTATKWYLRFILDPEIRDQVRRHAVGYGLRLLESHKKKHEEARRRAEQVSAHR